MKKYFIILSVAIIAVVSCTKKMEQNVVPETLQSILLGKDTLNMRVGDVRQLPFTLTPSDYSPSSIVLTVSDTTIVSITKAGILTAKKPGVVTVTARNQANTISVSGVISVLAKIPPIDSLKVGLILYFPFNKVSAMDSSGNGNNGTVFNISSVPDRFGNANSAYYFNGVNSYIDVKDNQALRLSGTDFTINSWVNLDQYSPNYGYFIASKRGTGVNNGWGTGIGGYGDLTNSVGRLGTVTYNVSGGPDPYAAGNIAVQIGTWHMVTVIYNHTTQQISLYVDGALDDVTNNMPTPNPSANPDLYIGGDNPAVTPPATSQYFFKGKIDDIRIYSRALKPTEISKLYHLPY